MHSLRSAAVQYTNYGTGGAFELPSQSGTYIHNYQNFIPMCSNSTYSNSYISRPQELSNLVALMAQGCSVPSAARALLRARGLLDRLQCSSCWSWCQTNSLQYLTSHVYESVARKQNSF